MQSSKLSVDFLGFPEFFSAWHDPLPLELGISSLASVVLAGHQKNLYVSYPYADLPLELKISSSLASVVLAGHGKNLYASYSYVDLQI